MHSNHKRDMILLLCGMIFIAMLDVLIFKEEILYSIMHSLYLPVFLRAVYLIKLILKIGDASSYEIIKFKWLEFFLFPVLAMIVAYSISKTPMLVYSIAALSLLAETYIAIQKKSSKQ